METKVNSNAKRTAIKVSLVAVISLLLLIPLGMIKGVIEEREQTKNSVTMEVLPPGNPQNNTPSGAPTGAPLL